MEDLVQETFIKAIKFCDTFQGDSSPKTWLYSIARNVAIDEQRKRKRRWMVSLPFMEKYEMKDEQTPEKIFELDEEKRELYQSIKTLKQTYQDVLILRGIEDLSVEETSAVLHWSENKVRVTFHRAIKALQMQKGKKEALYEQVR